MLKFETKIFQFEPTSFSLQFLLLANLCESEMIKKQKHNPQTRIEIIVEKKPSLHKKIWSIYREVLSVMWPNFTVSKYNSKLSNIYHHIKFRKSIMSKCSIKKQLLKILQYSQEKTCVAVSFLIKTRAFSTATLLKRDSNTGVFLWILRHF